LYRFFWSEYCDWYVESAKAVLTAPAPLDGQKTPPHPGPLPVGRGGEAARAAAMKANVLAVIDFVLSHTLRLFHPFLPFITEELWHAMGYHEEIPPAQGGQTIMFAPWPKPFDADFRDNYSLDDCYMDYVNAKYDLVSKGRNLRSEANIPSNKRVKFVFKPANSISPNDAEVLKVLLNADPLEINSDFKPAKGTPAVLAPLGELYLPLEGLIDVAAEAARLTKELEKIAGEIAKVEQKLNNPAFVQKVPPQVLEEHQKRLADWQAKQSRVQKALEDLKGS
jgi:valyl-tRNA synthetase